MYKMTYFIPDIVYEISKYLQKKDYLVIRLVFKNIIDDRIPYLGKYMSFLIDTKSIEDPMIKRFINHRDVLKLYFDIRERRETQIISTNDVLYDFGKKLDNLVVGDHVSIYRKDCISKDRIKDIYMSCIYDNECTFDNWGVRFVMNKIVYVSYKIQFIYSENVNALYRQIKDSHHAEIVYIDKSLYRIKKYGGSNYIVL
jgi:hypothetical protein